MNELDKWSAEKVGAILLSGAGVAHTDDYFKFGGDLYLYKWTLSDARCREIVREHFKINTTCGTNAELGAWYWAETAYPRNSYGKGKTIEAAELACIAAIKEAE